MPTICFSILKLPEQNSSTSTSRSSSCNESITFYISFYSKISCISCIVVTCVISKQRLWGRICNVSDIIEHKISIYTCICSYQQVTSVVNKNILSSYSLWHFDNRLNGTSCWIQNINLSRISHQKLFTILCQSYLLSRIISFKISSGLCPELCCATFLRNCYGSTDFFIISSKSYSCRASGKTIISCSSSECENIAFLSHSKPCCSSVKSCCILNVSCYLNSCCTACKRNVCRIGRCKSWNKHSLLSKHNFLYCSTSCNDESYRTLFFRLVLKGDHCYGCITSRARSIDKATPLLSFL